jgi:Protein of unknown function (DUF1214)
VERHNDPRHSRHQRWAAQRHLGGRHTAATVVMVRDVQAASGAPALNLDGSLDIYVQYESAGAHTESNRLPTTPVGPVIATIRVYWPPRLPRWSLKIAPLQKVTPRHGHRKESSLLGKQPMDKSSVWADITGRQQDVKD